MLFIPVLAFMCSLFSKVGAVLLKACEEADDGLEILSKLHHFHP